MKKSIFFLLPLLFLFPIVQADDLSLGLVAHYKFFNIDNSTVLDKQGNYDGFLYATGGYPYPIYVQTFNTSFNPALNITGASGVNITGLNLINDYSISLWIQNNGTGGNSFLGSKIDMINGNYTVLGLGFSNIGAVCYTYGCGNIFSNGTWSNQVWGMLTVVRNKTANNLKLYFDGIYVSTASSNVYDFVGDYKLISAYGSGATIAVDEARFYNRILTDSEILELHNNPDFSGNYIESILSGTCTIFATNTIASNTTLFCRTSTIDTTPCTIIKDIRGKFLTSYNITNNQFQNMLNSQNGENCDYHNLTKSYASDISGYFTSPANWNGCSDVFLTGWQLDQSAGGNNYFWQELLNNTQLYYNKRNITSTCRISDSNLNNSYMVNQCLMKLKCLYPSSFLNCTSWCDSSTGDLYSGTLAANNTCVNNVLIKSCAIGCGSIAACSEDIFINYTSKFNINNPVNISQFSIDWLFSSFGAAILISTMIAGFVAAKLPTADFKYKTWSFGLVFLAIMTIGIFFNYIPIWLIAFPILVLVFIVRKFIMSLIMGK